MAEPENWYQSWRKDQLRLAALAGAAFAGYWAYRRVRKHSREIDELLIAVFGCLGAVVLLPLSLPAYLGFWHSVATRSMDKIRRWDSEAQALLHRKQALEERAKKLDTRDQQLALEPLNRLDSELKRLTTKIQRQAELWATHLYSEVRDAEEKRAQVVSRMEQLDQRSLENELRENEATLQRARSRLSAVEGDYGVRPYDTPWQAVRDRFDYLGPLAALVGLWALLVALWNL